MATKTTINISPKVLTGLLTGLGFAAVEGIITAITPHTFDFLGQWEPLALAVVPSLLGQVAAWLKREHADAEKPATEAAADGSYNVTSLPAPAATPPVEPLLPLTADQIINGPAAVQAPLVPPTSL